jgi:hypothetical protein
MKRAFYFSLFGNVTLFAACVFLWVQGDVPPPSPDSPATQPFHWRQIDSADFPTFVSNLRSIGCPESIIRDIVQGEVTEIYADKERAAALAPSPNDGRPNSEAGGPMVVPTRQTPQEISTERDRTVAALLAPVRGTRVADAPSEAGLQPTLVASERVPPVSQVQPGPVPQAQSPVYPVFVSHKMGSTPAETGASGAGAKTDESIDSSNAAPASAEEQAVLERIQNNFVQAVGGLDQDPNDPSYLEKWQAAQKMSDAEYKKFFGGRAYVQRQMEGARRAALEKAAAGQ